MKNHRFLFPFWIITLITIAQAFCQPVTTHPRLWVTQNDLTRLRSWATPANPMYKNGFHSALVDAVTEYDAKFFPPALSAGLPLGNLDTAAVPSPAWPDMGTSNTEGYPLEAYAEMFAFASLVEQNPAERTAHARRARNLIMVAMREAVKGISDQAPYRDKQFITYNRANYWGEAWGLTVDWLQASPVPVLSAPDKKLIRQVFLLWTNQLLNAYTAGDEHPHPVGLINSPLLLSDTLQLRWAANNYYTGHARILATMSLAIDSVDDPSDQTTVLSGVAYPNLRSYIKNVTGAWLYQQYAVYEPAATVTSTLGVPSKGLGFAEGGLSVEGFMYGHALGYLLQTLLALHTAGYADPALSGPQIGLLHSPYWDKFVNGFLHSVAPVPNTVPNEPYLGSVYQYAAYGDVLRYFITYYDWTDAFGTLGVYDYLTGNTQRLAASRWIIANIFQGGDVYSRYNGGNIWGNAFASTSILMFLLFDPSVNVAALPNPHAVMPTDFVSHPLQRVLSRTEWGPDARWFTYKNSGATVNHQNGDASGFEFYRKGEWLVKQRSGYGIVTPDYLNIMGLQNTVSTNDTVPGNMPWFLGEVWTRGGQPNNGVNGGDPTGRISLQPGYVYTDADVTPMYNWPSQWTPSNDASDIQLASRSLFWLKPDLIVAYDRARSKTANRFKRTHLTTTGSVSVNGTQAIATTPNGQKMFVHSILPASARLTASPIETAEEINLWGGLAAEGEPAATRITIDDTLRPASTRFLTVIKGSDGAPVVCREITGQSGTPFHGVDLSSEHIAVLFPVDPSVPFAQLSYSVPKTTKEHFIAGLKARTSYTIAGSIVDSTLTVSVAPGIGILSDSAGVLHCTSSVLSADEGAVHLPEQFSLHQNYPNPFNPTTTIRYELPHAARVSLRLFNAVGQEMMTLVDGMENAGMHTVSVDAHALASGIYFYELKAGPFRSVKKMTLIR